ncbi:hypothetical protein [Haloarcula amylolytica]|nr:hypothetical protein [Haloarcula amylolytica]
MGSESTDLTVHLHGESHFRSYEAVQRSLEKLTASVDIDAFYHELPSEVPGMKRYIQTALRNPLYVVGVFVTQMIYGPRVALTCGHQQGAENQVIKEFAAAADTPVTRIDTHPSYLVPELSLIWTVVSWIVFGGFLWLQPIAVGLALVLILLLGTGLTYLARKESDYERPLAVLLGWGGILLLLPLNFIPLTFAFAGFVAHGLVVRATLGRRDIEMVNRTIQDATAHDYTQIWVSVGYKHLDGMSDAFESHGVEVICHSETNN